MDIISPVLARLLCQAAFAARRLVGVLIDRKGEVRFVIVGDAHRLYLPDIGRVRAGKDRLRGLRLIVARPQRASSEGLADDFRTDLEKLRLDAVAEIDASSNGLDGSVILAYLSQQGVLERKFSNVVDIDESFADFIDAIIEDLAQQDKLRPAKDKRKFLERALLIGVYDTSKKIGQASMAELAELARSARVEAVETIYQWSRRKYPKTFIGTAKLEEICLQALSLGIEMLIFDHELSPSQLNNITDLTDLKILDRSMLILDIFAQRAVTREGKLQVEMAQLSYSLPRLAKKQSGLSRLTGGIGGRGPGETRLEVDRRRVKDRLSRLSDELERIKKQRELRRKSRKNREVPTFAIVGYTNAGKSTLLNALCGADIYAKDELFATLDPHSRRLRFPSEREVLITDTVGFINNLPESLMKAFMATLEELQDADVLIHVVDIADDNYKQQIRVVEQVLSELELNNKKRLTVFNKIDKLEPDLLSERLKGSDLAISASKKIGLAALIKACVKVTEPEEDIEFDERA